MTDETPEAPRPLKVITCINRRHPSRSCYLLIEDDRDVKLAHRQWHIDREDEREALRRGVKERDDKIAALTQEIAGYRRDVEQYGKDVQGYQGEVQRVETPTIPPQLTINRDGYSDEELEDEPDEPDPWAGLDSAASAAADQALASVPDIAIAFATRPGAVGEEAEEAEEDPLSTERTGSSVYTPRDF